MIFFTRLTAVLLLAVTCLDGAAAPAPIVIRFSHVAGEDTPKGKAAEYFKKLAEERTRGRVRVDVFADSTLYGDKDELEAVQLGAVQMLAASLTNFSALGLREFEAFELPYLFDSYETLHKITEGPVGSFLLRKLETKGIYGLAYWDLGFKQMTADRPLRWPKDFKGLRMRIRYSEVAEAQMKALNAIPQPMPLSESAREIRAAVIDGGEFTASTIYRARLDEVQKYITVSNHGYVGSVVVVNRRFWEKLPADIRAALEGAVREATRFANDAAKKENDGALAAMKQQGRTTVITLSPEEIAAWKDALMKVHHESEGRIPPEVLLSIYQEAGFNAK